MIDSASLLTALALGFFSSAHCVGMCGGIMGALTMAVAPQATGRKAAIIGCYNLGRILTYTLIGVLVGALGLQFTQAGAGPALRILAALLLLAMAFYLADWWRGLTRIEALGRSFWRALQPLGQRLLPVRGPWQALFLGLIWGWLPCGLVYTALSYAATRPGALAGGTFMLAFGLGTLPAVIVTAAAAGRMAALARSRLVRSGAALALVVFALWTFYGALGGHGHHDHGAEAPASSAPSEPIDPSHHHHHH